jgi:hypothetical protein
MPMFRQAYSVKSTCSSVPPGGANVGEGPYTVDRVVNVAVALWRQTEARLVMEHVYPVECALPGSPFYKDTEEETAENRRAGIAIVKPVTA